MKQETINTIKRFTSLDRMFTSLDVSNEVKQCYKLDIKHSDISPIVRELFDNGMFPGYIRTEILVTAEIVDAGGELLSDTRSTYLYHPQGDDPADYTTRSLKATQILKADADVDDADDDDAPMIAINDPDGAYAYTTLIHTHGLSLYTNALATRNLENEKFDMVLTPQEIRLFKTDNKRSVVQTTKLGHLRISNTDLERVGLDIYNDVWVHVYDNRIIINELSPKVMALRKYTNCLVKFTVDTPSSKTGETTQTVVLKVTSVSATKDSEYLLHGYNIKRLADNADDIQGALRQYRIDRIDFSTFVELE